MFFLCQTLGFVLIYLTTKQFLKNFYAQQMLLQNRPKECNYQVNLKFSNASFLLLASTTSVCYETELVMALFQHVLGYLVSFKKDIKPKTIFA